MKFCQAHWDALRESVEAAGLGDLVAEGGETAALQMKDQIDRDEVTPANFDPLMGAHWAIVSNALRIASGGAGPASGLYLMQDSDTPEDPVDFLGYANGGRVMNRLSQAGLERTWPRCPVCYLNLAHELSCADPRCGLDRERGYDWMLDRAAEEQAEKARELGVR